MSFTSEQRDTIKIISWECINKFKENILKEICKLKHKEVDNVNEKIGKVDKKLNWFFAVLIVALLTFFIGSGDSGKLTKADIKDIVQIVMQHDRNPGTLGDGE